MLPESEMRRVARQLALPGYGPEQQEALHRAHVLVIGAGGLGCPAMQSLASAGVGHITVIDDDTVDLTNIHRQILFGASDVGRVKVEVAAERLAELQPGIEVTALNERLTVANAVSLVGSVDLVIDGSDSFQTKYLVADAAEITGTPLVWGTVLRFHGDVCLFTSGPSARGVGLRDLFPTQPPGIEDCATAGVLGATTAVVGGLLATTAIGYLTGLDVVPGRMLSYDAFPGSTRTFRIAADPTRELVTSLESTYGARPARSAPPRSTRSAPAAPSSSTSVSRTRRCSTTPSPTSIPCGCRCRTSSPPTPSAAASAMRSAWWCTAPPASAPPASASSTRTSATSSSTCPAASTAYADGENSPLRVPTPTSSAMAATQRAAACPSP